MMAWPAKSHLSAAPRLFKISRRTREILNIFWGAKAQCQSDESGNKETADPESHDGGANKLFVLRKH